MGWQDREYNAGRENLNAYFANPEGLLQFSIPFYRSAGLNIRLHFWLLIAAVFQIIQLHQNGFPLYYAAFDLPVMLICVLLHEAGHQFFARRVGGNHWEWVLWPLGGMVPPTCPKRPWNTFIANAGGIFVSGPLLAIGWVALGTLPHVIALFGWAIDPFNPLMVIASYDAPVNSPYYAILAPAVHTLGFFCQVNAAILIVNLFPAFWFDGGYIWMSVLWPKFGNWKADAYTCMAGMILSPIFLLLSLYKLDFLGMVIWALVFSNCFNRRRALMAAGPGVIGEDDAEYNYMDAPAPRRKKMKRRWLRSAKKKATRDQAQQAKIDAILAKVKEKGLHSLTWWEKRTLKKATERQRQQDLAERL